MTLNEWRLLEQYKKEIYKSTMEWMNKEAIYSCEKLIKLANKEDSMWIWIVWDITDLIYAKTFMWFNYINLHNIEEAIHYFKEVDEYWQHKVDFDELVIDDIWVYFFIWYVLSVLMKEWIVWNMGKEIIGLLRFKKWKRLKLARK